MTASLFCSAFTPHRNDVVALRAALAYVVALLMGPVRRVRQTLADDRLTRLEVAAVRAALMGRSAPSGLGQLPTGAVPTSCDGEGFYLVVVAAPTAPPAVLDVLDVFEPVAALEVSSPVVVDPPAAPARTKRVRKPAAPKKTATKKAANPPVEKRPAVRFPSIKDVAAALRSIKDDLDSLPEEDAAEGIDVRLQISEGGWALHSGDAQYDTDHRGFWGASSVMADTNCRELARDLIEEAKDDEAQSR